MFRYQMLGLPPAGLSTVVDTVVDLQQHNAVPAEYQTSTHQFKLSLQCSL